LGAPVGSVLASGKSWNQKPGVCAKYSAVECGRQVFWAAAGYMALDHHITRLNDDHHRAEELGKALARQPFVKSMMPWTPTS